MTKLTLDPRLQTIAELLGPRTCVADIGADHGRLGAYLLQNGLAERVQFLDISVDSLSKARDLIAKLDLSARAAFGVGDGALAMTGPADACVIAGMGGQLIADIVERGWDRLRDCLLVLQPNVAQYELRLRLSRAGFRIDAERLVRAAKRWYVLISASAGASDYTERELIVGPRLLKDDPPELSEYAARQLRIAQVALRGAESGGAPWRAALRFEAECWEGIIREQGNREGHPGAGE